MIEITRATAEDLELVQQFGFKLLDFERKNWDSDLDPSWPFSEVGKQKYLEAIQNKYSIIAKIDGQPAGFLIGKITEAAPSDARQIKQARLENIYVNEEYRKNGVGMALFENFRQHCKKENVTRLDVAVLANNEVAAAFYKRVGFAARSINYSQAL